MSVRGEVSPALSRNHSPYSWFLTNSVSFCTLTEDLMPRTRLDLNGVADGLSFALACQQVMALRLVRIAFGGTSAQREMTRMVTEKAAAAAEAQVAAAIGLATGGPAKAAKAAANVYRRAVSANGRRLRKN